MSNISLYRCTTVCLSTLLMGMQDTSSLGLLYRKLPSTCLHMLFSSLLDKYLGHRVVVSLTFKTLSNRMYHFMLLLAIYESSDCGMFSHFIHYSGCPAVSCDFHLHSWRIVCAFSCAYCHFIIIFCEILKSFVQFLFGCLFYYWVAGVLDILDTSHLSYVCVVNYFSQSVNCLSIFLMVFFNPQEFLILMIV